MAVVPCDPQTNIAATFATVRMANRDLCVEISWENEGGRCTGKGGRGFVRLNKNSISTTIILHSILSIIYT